MDIQELLKGLPVKVISKDEVEVDGFALTRVDIETWKYEPFRSVGSLGYRVLLAAMDEFAIPERKPTRVRAMGTESDGTKCVLTAFDRHPVSCCRHVPEPNGGQDQAGSGSAAGQGQQSVQQQHQNVTSRPNFMREDAADFSKFTDVIQNKLQKEDGPIIGDSAPAKKEAGELFTGDHWKNAEGRWLLSDADIKRCIRDLRDAILKK